MAAKCTTIVVGALAVACGGGGGDDMPAATGFAVVAAPGDTLTANAGDAIQLEVVQTFADDSQGDLPTGATATFTAPATVTALPPSSTGPSALPAFGAAPTAAFIVNMARPDRAADLAGVLFVLDAGASGSGTAIVTAAIAGSASGSASGMVPVTALPAGNAARGASTYAGACASCHGANAEGSPVGSDGMYSLDGSDYAYPAPALGSAAAGIAGDPAWDAALLAVAARADITNHGVALREPMPDWLEVQIDGAPLSTSDFADIYAFLKTK
jgi:mono/diheme cytochrome c family protein